MLYLPDANVLITAHNTYYSLEQVPEFWEWLRHQAEEGHLKVPLEIMDEVKDGNDDDPLCVWIKGEANAAALLLDPAIVQRVVNEGYAPDLTDDQVEAIGRDPFLVAYALAQPERCVVTTEVSAPSKVRHNRKLPDVCQTFGLPCVNTFRMTRVLGFKTGWALPPAPPPVAVDPPPQPPPLPPQPQPQDEGDSP